MDNFDNIVKTKKKTRYASPEELQQARERKGKHNRTVRGKRIEWQPEEL